MVTYYDNSLYYLAIILKLKRKKCLCVNNMPFTHIIKDINLCITNIVVNDIDDSFIIEAINKNSNFTTKYEFCISDEQKCCERVGSYYAEDISKSEKNNKELYNKELYNKFIGDTIDNIYFYESMDMEPCENEHNTRFSIIMQINLNNGKCFYFVIYSEHNGSYSRDVWLNVYENGDITPIRVIDTCV